MRANKFAKWIYWSGIFIIVFGIMGSFILGDTFSIVTVHGIYDMYAEKTYNIAVAIGGSFGSLLGGIFFIGFSEIIELVDVRTQKIVKILDDLEIFRYESMSNMEKFDDSQENQ